MKKVRSICLILCLLLLTGCAEPSGLTGSWEAETQMSVLGPEKQEEVTGMTRFLFRPDNTGSWCTEIGAGYPEAVREFRYTREDDILLLTFEGEEADTEFAMILSGDSLKLENTRGSFELKRIK